MLPLFVSESPQHAAAVSAVLDAAFGPGRFAKVSERVREFAAFSPSLSRVAVLGGRVIGCCRIWRVSVADRSALFLGPLAVDPAAQHGGVGHQLVSQTLAACDEAALPIVLVGSPNFFAPFGFVQIPDGAVSLPGPVEARRFQWRLPDAEPLSGAVSAPHDAKRA